MVCGAPNQGDTLGPYLSTIALDFALPETWESNLHEEETDVKPKVVSDFEFAEDITLPLEEISQALELLVPVESSCVKFGLKIDAIKA